MFHNQAVFLCCMKNKNNVNIDIFIWSKFSVDMWYRTGLMRGVKLNQNSKVADRKTKTMS